MRKQTKKAAQIKLQQDLERLENAIKEIDEYSHLLTRVDKYRLQDLTESINSLGYSLVKTSNLADFYKVNDFCESNKLEIISAY